MKRAPSVPAEYLALVRDYRKEEKQRESTKKKQKVNEDTVKEDSSDNELEFDDVKISDEEGETYNDTSKEDVHAVENHEPDESESEGEYNMEDVDLSNLNSDNLTVSLEASKASHLTRSRGSKKKSMNKPERLFLHKLYLMAWMLYSKNRNKWCSDEIVLERLKLFLPDNVISLLHPPSHLTPFLKSKKFVEGLQVAMNMWSDNFEVITPEEDAEFDQPETFEEFNGEIMNMIGTKATLGLGMVALMRSVGAEARLICSLQPPDNLNSTPSKKVNPFNSSSPIFWAEVWDPYANKWASLDPLTSTFRFPNRTKMKLKLEPALSDSSNIMRYCIAWNAKNKARDVTRRYSSNYNARTRKKRLPYVDETGSEWLDKLYSHFANFSLTKRDKDEITELSKYPRLEGIPQRAQDFIGHPEYALLDQLHYNEILRKGAVRSGVLTLKNQKKPVYIYKRSDVLTCRTAQTWYRSYGRVIKPMEQPVTHRSLTNRLTGEHEETGMYTYDQTELYVPPPVSPEGVVPKSQYRTIDLFCPTMLPKGACHIIDKQAARAAKFLRVDYANAVVKIEYGKRGAVSQYSGIVVAKKFAQAVILVLQGYRELDKLEAERAEARRLIELWRKIIVGIQIWDRIEKMNPDGSKNNTENDNQAQNSTADSEQPLSSSDDSSEYTPSVDSDDNFRDRDMDEIDDDDL